MQHPDTQPRIQVHLDWLRCERKVSNPALQDRLQEHSAWQFQAELLRSVLGIGPVVAVVLMAEMPELILQW